MNGLGGRSSGNTNPIADPDLEAGRTPWIDIDIQAQQEGSPTTETVTGEQQVKELDDLAENFRDKCEVGNPNRKAQRLNEIFDTDAKRWRDIWKEAGELSRHFRFRMNNPQAYAKVGDFFLDLDEAEKELVKVLQAGPGQTCISSGSRDIQMQMVKERLREYIPKDEDTQAEVRRPRLTSNRKLMDTTTLHGAYCPQTEFLRLSKNFLNLFMMIQEDIPLMNYLNRFAHFAGCDDCDEPELLQATVDHSDRQNQSQIHHQENQNHQETHHISQERFRPLRSTASSVALSIMDAMKKKEEAAQELDDIFSGTQMINQFTLVTLLREPMICSDGYTYERASLERFFRDHGHISPYNRAELIPLGSMRQNTSSFNADEAEDQLNNTNSTSPVDNLCVVNEPVKRIYERLRERQTSSLTSASSSAANNSSSTRSNSSTQSSSDIDEINWRITKADLKKILKEELRCPLSGLSGQTRMIHSAVFSLRHLKTVDKEELLEPTAYMFNPDLFPKNCIKDFLVQELIDEVYFGDSFGKKGRVWEKSVRDLMGELTGTFEKAFGVEDFEFFDDETSDEKEAIRRERAAARARADTVVGGRLAVQVAAPDSATEGPENFQSSMSASFLLTSDEEGGQARNSTQEEPSSSSRDSTNCQPNKYKFSKAEEQRVRGLIKGLLERLSKAGDVRTDNNGDFFPVGWPFEESQRESSRRHSSRRRNVAPQTNSAAAEPNNPSTPAPRQTSRNPFVPSRVAELESTLEQQLPFRSRLSRSCRRNASNLKKSAIKWSPTIFKCALDLTVLLTYGIIYSSQPNKRLSLKIQKSIENAFDSAFADDDDTDPDGNFGLVLIWGLMTLMFSACDHHGIRGTPSYRTTTQLDAWRSPCMRKSVRVFTGISVAIWKFFFVVVLGLGIIGLGTIDEYDGVGLAMVMAVVSFLTSAWVNWKFGIRRMCNFVVILDDAATNTFRPDFVNQWQQAIRRETDAQRRREKSYVLDDINKSQKAVVDRVMGEMVARETVAGEESAV